MDADEMAARDAGDPTRNDPVNHPSRSAPLVDHRGNRPTTVPGD
jgi:hypothetical protein